MAKQNHRATSRIEGLREKGDVIEAGEKVTLDDKLTKDLLAPKGPLELLAAEDPPAKKKEEDPPK